MLESRILGALTTGIFAFILSSSSTFAQEGHGGKPAGEAEAPTNCGVLGLCDGGDKVFMYWCQGDKVVVRRCGKGSRYKIEDQKDCVGVGVDREIAKTDFRSFINAQLNKQELHGKLGAITKEDIRSSRSTVKLSDAKSCLEKLESQISNLENQIAQLGDAMDAPVKAWIQKQIDYLKTESLVKAKADFAACSNQDAAIAKINTQIDEAVNKICSKNGIHVPKTGEFLHTVLSQYDPSKLPCPTEKEDCAQEIWVRGDVVGAVVKRTINNKGVVEEFVKDKASKLTWSPEAPTNMNHKDAEAFCAAKKDLGLKWSLPSKEDFLVAFNPSNRNKENNENFIKVLETRNRLLWSSSVHESLSDYAWGLEWEDSRSNITIGRRDDPYYSFRCVGR